MSYWARQQHKMKEDTIKIADLIREGAPFMNWDTQARQILSLALYPVKLSDEDGRWTIEGRHALNLLRHLVKAGNFMRAPVELQQPSLEMDESSKTLLAERAFHVRRELVGITPPWTLVIR